MTTVPLSSGFLSARGRGCIMMSMHDVPLSNTPPGTENKVIFGRRDVRTARVRGIRFLKLAASERVAGE